MRMSCNGCRVLRKGCSDNCSIRPSLQWIKSPESQAHATVFLAKFYGRAGLMNLINAGPEHLRPAIFRSLLYEACGRIVNPIYGSVGLLWSGSWHLCQAAVEAVLKGAPITRIASEAAANGQGPPLKAYDIRHVSKDENSGAELHRVKSRCRFKRSSTSGAVVKPNARRVGFGSVADSGTAQTGEYCADELNRSTSHDSSVSHEAEAGVANVDGDSKEAESMISEETIEATTALFRAAEPELPPQKQSSSGSMEAVELELTLGIEPTVARAVHHAVVPVKKRRFEVMQFGWGEERAGSCKMELGLDYTA